MSASPDPKVGDEEEVKAMTTKGAKPFLKRKTQTMKGGKIKWDVKSRTDCWSGPAKVKEATP